MNRKIRALAAALAVSFASILFVSTGWAEDYNVPTTVAEHMALAQQYKQKATAYQAEAAEHRKMAEAYKKSVASTPKNLPNPWVTKMEKHCNVLAKDAEKLASDAQKAAEYHELRAKELEGK